MVLPKADRLTIYYVSSSAGGGEAGGLLAPHVPELTEFLKVGPRGQTCGPDKLITSYILFMEVFLLLPLNYLWKLDLIILSVLYSR